LHHWQYYDLVLVYARATIRLIPYFVVSVSQFIRDVPARERILLKRLVLGDGCEPLCSQPGTELIRVSDHKRVAHVVILEGLNKLGWWFLLRASQLYSRLLRHLEYVDV
jgi:hypothetical protein